jgi:hypothetical protein
MSKTKTGNKIIMVGRSLQPFTPPNAIEPYRWIWQRWDLPSKAVGQCYTPILHTYNSVLGNDLSAPNPGRNPNNPPIPFNNPWGKGGRRGPVSISPRPGSFVK